MIIAGIGSRETPDRILNEMRAIGAWCWEQEIWIRSGHADGADWAFERGAQEYCIAYLPWAGFNSQLISKAHQHVVHESRWLDKLVWTYHPAPDKLTRGPFALMRRNGAQVLGIDDTQRSQAIVCWTSDGLASGGTGQAIRIAQSSNYNIPVLNMQRPMYNTAEKVIAYLQGER